MQSIKERDAFSRRLKEALKQAGDDGSSPTRLAREFNRRYPGEPVTLHAARKWLNGDALPAQDKVRVLARWLGVGVDWLRFGDGNQTVCSEGAELVDFELMRLIGALSPDHREAVRVLAKALRRGEKRQGKPSTNSE
jgi:hypothetical protein